MGDDQNLSLAVIFYQIVVIRNDIVNTEKVFLRKTNTRIDNQYLILVFKAVHIFTDFAQSSHSIDESISAFRIDFIITVLCSLLIVSRCSVSIISMIVIHK